MLLLGLLLALLVYAVVTVIIFSGLWLARGLPQNLAWIEDLLEADTPEKLLILLTTFIGMALGPMAAVAMLHERSAGSLFGRAPVVLRDFSIATLAAGSVLGLSLIPWFVLNEPIPGLAYERWILFLPIALIGIVVQTGAEEILFRGYIQQQLAARFRSPFVWALIPSVLFGFAHFDVTSAGDNAILVVLSAGLFGLLAAELTARTGSIGAAWGFHFANNTLALLVVSTEGTLTGLALFRTPYDISDTEAIRAAIPLDLAMLILIWFVIRRLVSR